MPRVRFTDVVDNLFGGTYATAEYEAHTGTEIVLTDAEYKRLGRDFPGLVKLVDAKARPGDDELPG